MKSILVCIALLTLAACSRTTQNPIDKPGVNCAQTQKPNQQPVDGGVGGTGALPKEDCQPPAVN